MTVQTAVRPQARPGAGTRTRTRVGRHATTVTAAGLLVAGSGLVPWLYVLATTLPSRTEAWHWPAAWVGLDLMEAAGLLGTGLLLLRADSRYRLTAAATAALLTTDAWFDVVTAPPGKAQLTSVLMAAVAELPAAAACTWLAVHEAPGRPGPNR